MGSYTEELYSRKASHASVLKALEDLWSKLAAKQGRRFSVHAYQQKQVKEFEMAMNQHALQSERDNIRGKQADKIYWFEEEEN